MVKKDPFEKIKAEREKRLKELNRNRDSYLSSDKKESKKLQSSLNKKILDRQKETEEISKEIYNTLNPKEIKGNVIEYRKNVEKAVKAYKDMVINSVKDDKINFADNNSLVPGGVYMFNYYPKYYSSLVEFDPNPVIIYISEGKKQGNIYGLNFKYINPTTRKLLLTSYVNDRKTLTENDDLLINTSLFEEAKKRRNLKYMFHEYIFSGPYLIGNFKRLSPKGYENIINLPNTILPGGKGII